MNSRTRLATAALVATSFFTLVVGGCELIAVADRDRISDGAGGSGTGGAGGGDDCIASECPGNDTDCEKRACVSGACALEPEPEGTTCSDDGNPNAKVCDGVGACVECVTRDDCAGTELCVDLLCVPENCVNGELDGDESDVDCGGSCSPCDNGDDCGQRTDCVSGFCDSGTCAACTPGVCDTGQYCDAGVCTDKLDPGDVCTDAVQCASGFCPAHDGVCCDTACDSTCEACLSAKNSGSANGTCAPVEADTDPDSECPQDDALCQAAGCSGSTSCNVAADTVVCRPGTGDVCDPAEQCESGVCPSDDFEPGTTPCRTGSGDPCDPTEMCPGVAGMACPPDFFEDDMHVCRIKVGGCDVEERCPGTAQGTCPMDGFMSMGSLGDPDCMEFVCSGSSADCPTECTTTADCEPPGTCNTANGKCQ